MQTDKRKRLAVVCIACLVILIGFLLTNRFQDLAANPAFSFVFKLAIAAGVLWLAWPDLIRLKDRFPPKFLIIAPISMLALVIQPRFGAGLLGITIMYWLGWTLYRRLFGPVRLDRTSRSPTKKSEIDP